MFAGAHTRCIAVTTPSNAAGGIMKFAKKKLACLGCKAPIATGSLCAHCAPKVGLAGPMRLPRCFLVMQLLRRVDLQCCMVPIATGSLCAHCAPKVWF